MEGSRLKEHILENNFVPTILENIGCHHIRNKGGYYQCANPDGDNVSAITVYLNSNLTTINYTRDISGGSQHGTDIFSLVEFCLKCNFFRAVEQVCEWIGISYYHNFDADIPQSLKITKMILEMQSGELIEDEDSTISPIPERVLGYYRRCVNDMLKTDGISYKVQDLFEVGYDEVTNRITFPIRDELGRLVGVKGRLFAEHIGENEDKYIYLEPCARRRVLYGLYLALPEIQHSRTCYVVEAEKGVQQMWTIGHKNVVATGGKKISSHQIEKLTRLCADIVFLFDKDVERSELDEIANRFIDGVNVYAAIDKNSILLPKESPTDNPEKLKTLLAETVKIR